MMIVVLRPTGRPLQPLDFFSIILRLAGPVCVSVGNQLASSSITQAAMLMMLQNPDGRTGRQTGSGCWRRCLAAGS